MCEQCSRWSASLGFKPQSGYRRRAQDIEVRHVCEEVSCPRQLSAWLAVARGGQRAVRQKGASRRLFLFAGPGSADAELDVPLVNQTRNEAVRVHGPLGVVAQRQGTGPSMQVDDTAHLAFGGELHQEQLAVRAGCGLAHVRGDEPGTIVRVKLAALLELGEVHQEGREGVHVVVLVSDGHPAVVLESVDGEDIGPLELIGTVPPHLMLVEGSRAGDLEVILSIAEDGVDDISFRLHLGIDTVGASGDSALVVDFFDDEVESIRKMDAATQRASGRLEQVLVLPAREERLDAPALERAGAELARYAREQERGRVIRRRVFEDWRSGVRFSGVEDWLPALVETEDPLDALGALRVITWLPDDIAASARELVTSSAVQRLHGTVVAMMLVLGPGTAGGVVRDRVQDE